MADDPSNEPEPATDPDPEPQNDPAASDPEGLGDAGKRALDAERKARRDAEARLKELEPVAAKAKELEDAQKTEQQKLAEALEAAKAEGSTSKTRLQRLEVALDAAPEGMPVAKIRKLAQRLTGTTPEELEADAKELFAEFSGEPVVPVTRRQGGQGAPEPDASKLADAVIQRRGY
jgi:hypothetical protein